jgi:hypothetical protein
MNINATNQSLINILLQQATKTSEKKPRPTFEEVFSKLNTRTMNANKQPMNNMLTNEQLFRYYIKETDPKLRVSDESFNIEDTLNPMKESDPNKVYGVGTTQSTDTIPSRNPYNNGMNTGFQDPLQAQAEARARAAGINPRTGQPISGKLAALAQQYNTAPPPFAMPPTLPLPQKVATTLTGIAAAPDVPDPADAIIATPASLLPIGGDAVLIDYNMAKDELDEAQNVMGRLSEVDWGSIPPETQTIFSILFNNNDFYTTETTEYMKGLITAGTIDRALEGINLVFKQTKGNPAVNNFITERIALMMGIDRTSGIASIERFNTRFNPNNIGIGDGRITMEQFKVNVINYINTQRTLQGNEKLRVDKTIIEVEDRGLANNANKYIGEITSRFQALELQYNSLMPTASAMMADLFSDGISELTTNTDINSLVLDPELIKNLADRNAPSAAKRSGSGLSPLNVLPPSAYIPPGLMTGSASSVIAEAGSPAGIDIDNVIERRGRGGRGPDKLPRKTPARTEAANTINAAMRRTLEQQGIKTGTSV